MCPSLRHYCYDYSMSPAYETKACTKCGESRPMTNFERIRRGDREYFRGECSPCRLQRMRDRHHRHREDASIKHAEWRAKNKEHIKAQRRVYYLANKERLLAQNRAWQKANSERVSLLGVAWRVGLTVDAYLELLARYDGQCAICSATSSGAKGKSRLSVDHDHSCCPGYRSCGNCIRGPLCNDCNTGISRFDDNPDRLIAAAAYLMCRRDVLSEAGLCIST